MLSFDYHKSPTDISKRVFVPIASPAEKYFGIDVTELSLEDQVAFEIKLKDIQDEQKAKIDDLLREFDSNHKYRFFFPEKMQNVVVET